MTVQKDNVFGVDVCLFDMDGTIVNTTEAAEAVWKRLCVQENVDPEELFKHSHGAKAGDIMAQYFPNVDNTDGKKVQAIEKELVDDFEDIVKLVPGSKELLLSLDKDSSTGAPLAGRKWAIVTSATPYIAFHWFTSILKEVGKPDVFITALDVKNGKPDPEGYSKACDLLCNNCNFDRSIARSVVFEDAPVGIKAGKAMGAVTVGITTSYDKGVLFDAGADFVVNDLTQVRLLRNNDQDGIVFEIVNPLVK
ncbi:HAD family hydrolase [Nakaseomyces bracarensis]|uniref:HAD family hydrolase n=1 Tax=Nakaseomyces bracarensis TaxID=273131 RepID=UPI00387173E4